MSADQQPKQSPSKNFQEQVVEAIANAKDDITAFKKCCVGKNDINRRLLPHKELKIEPSKNPDQRYINIRGPTMLMYAILCEQSQIVEYMLDNKNPDVSKKVEGYNCLHLAAMVKDPTCLKLLLQHDWIQENIDEKIDLLGTNEKEQEKTTALHVAVSNRRYANAILLLDNFPEVRWPPKKDKSQNNKEANTDTPSDQPDEEKKEEEDITERNPAGVNQKSASGSTPLYIAVYLRDYKMARILLACDADLSIPSANGKTPLELAIHNRDYKMVTLLLSYKPDLSIKGSNGKTPLEYAKDIKEKRDNEKKNEQSQQTPPKKSKSENNDIELIIEALEKEENREDNENDEAFEEKKDTLDYLKREYAPELIDKKEKNSSESSDEEEKREDEEKPSEGGEEQPEKEKKKSKSQSAYNEKLLTKIYDQLKQLNTRLTTIENERRAYPNQPPPTSSEVTRDAVCSNCGASGANQCPQCHKYYCDLCSRKQTVHKCTV